MGFCGEETGANIREGACMDGIRLGFYYLWWRFEGGRCHDLAADELNR
jgi:hypothetical protein